MRQMFTRAFYVDNRERPLLYQRGQAGVARSVETLRTSFPKPPEPSRLPSNQGIMRVRKAQRLQARQAGTRVKYRILVLSPREVAA
jgi:hypothetical protein